MSIDFPEKIDFSGEMGEDLIGYLKHYIDETDTLLKTSLEQRELLAMLYDHDNLTVEDMEEIDDSLREVLHDPKKRAEAIDRLQKEVDTVQEQFKMIKTLMHSLFEETARRIEGIVTEDATILEKKQKNN